MIPPPPGPDVYGQFRSSGEPAQAPAGAPAAPPGAPGAPQPSPAPAAGGGGLLLAVLAGMAGYFLGRRNAVATPKDD